MRYGIPWHSLLVHLIHASHCCWFSNLMYSERILRMIYKVKVKERKIKKEEKRRDNLEEKAKALLLNTWYLLNVKK